MKKLSVQTKYALVLAAILVVLVGLQLLFNHVFMEKYYLSRKLDRIGEIRAQVEEYIRENSAGAGAEDSEMKLRTGCEAAGIDALVIKADRKQGVVIFTNASELGGGPRRLLNALRGQNGDGELAVYAEGDGYRVYRTQDAFTGTEQIDCVGFVAASQMSGGTSKGSADGISFSEDGYYYVLTVAVAEIAETADIYNRLLIRVGLVTLLIGAVTMYLVSGRLTRPIKQMTSLSRKMADLDFSERYTGGTGDEIQTLGVNMNEMATKLESAIENLKAANTALAEDIAEKDETDRQRRELLSNISHELKTPIAVIRGYAEGLKDGISEDAEMRDRYCDVIADEAEKMNRMVRRLLDLDELESRAGAAKDRFDLAEMLRGEANAFLLKSRRDGVTLTVDVPGELSVWSDDYLWEQVLQNYLSNAFHYVNTGGTVLARAEKNAREGVKVTVFNTGDAIPDESLDKIWNKFYKVDKARTRAYGGSGIGLSIVQAAMDRLGGSCAAANVPGGVEFTAELDGCLVPPAPDAAGTEAEESA